MKQVFLAALAALAITLPSGVRAGSAFDELMVALNMSETIVQTALIEAETDVRRNYTIASEDKWAIFMHDMAVGLRDKWPHIKRGLRHIYEKHFTDQEMMDMAAFYRTPIGRKWVALTPQLSAEMVQLARSVGDSLVLEIIERNRLRAEGLQ